MATVNPLSSALSSYSTLQNMEYMRSLAKSADLQNESTIAEQDIMALTDAGVFTPSDFDGALPGAIQFTGDPKSMPPGMLAKLLNSSLPKGMLMYKGVVGKKKRKQGTVDSVVRVTEENMEQLGAAPEQVGSLKIILKTPSGRKVPMGRDAVEGEDPANDLFLSDNELKAAMNVAGSTLLSKSALGRQIIAGHMAGEQSYKMSSEGISAMPGMGGQSYSDLASPGYIARGGTQNIGPQDVANMHKEQLARYDKLTLLLNNPDADPAVVRKVFAALTELNMQLGLVADPNTPIIADNEVNPNTGQSAGATPDITRKLPTPQATSGAGGHVSPTETQQKQDKQQEPSTTYSDTININPALPKAGSYEEAKEGQLEAATNAGTGSVQVLDYEKQPRLLKKDKWLEKNIEAAIEEADRKRQGEHTPPAHSPVDKLNRTIFEALGLSTETGSITKENWQTVYDHLTGMKSTRAPAMDAVDTLLQNNPDLGKTTNTSPPALTEKDATDMRAYMEQNKITNIQALLAHERTLSKEKARAMNWVIASYSAKPMDTYNNLNDQLNTGVGGYTYGQMIDDQIYQQQIGATGNAQAAGYVDKFINGEGSLSKYSFVESLGEDGMFVNLDAGKNEDGEWAEQSTIEDYSRRMSRRISNFKSQNAAVKNDPGARNALHTEAGNYYWALAKKYPSSTANRVVAPKIKGDYFMDWLPAVLKGHKAMGWWEDGLSNPANMMVIVKEGDDLRLSFMVDDNGKLNETNRSVQLIGRGGLLTAEGPGSPHLGIFADMGIRFWDRDNDEFGSNIVTWTGQGLQ